MFIWRELNIYLYIYYKTLFIHFHKNLKELLWKLYVIFLIKYLFKNQIKKNLECINCFKAIRYIIYIAGSFKKIRDAYWYAIFCESKTAIGADYKSESERWVWNREKSRIISQSVSFAREIFHDCLSLDKESITLLSSSAFPFPRFTPWQSHLRIDDSPVW